MAKSVTVIPQTRNIFTTAPISTTARRKVAGYARVSTDSDEQFTSYEAQVDYYTNYIQSHPEWEFVKVYTDEGISAVSTRHRDGFNEMVEDALAGKNLVPFSTHEGSGLSGFDEKLSSAVPGSTVLKGFATKGNDCQNKQDSVRESVKEWIAELGM